MSGPGILRKVDAVTVRVPDIDAGRLGVVVDPFGNGLVLLDLSKGTYNTDATGEVIGVS